MIRRDYPRATLKAELAYWDGSHIYDPNPLFRIEWFPASRPFGPFTHDRTIEISPGDRVALVRPYGWNAGPPVTIPGIWALARSIAIDDGPLEMLLDELQEAIPDLSPLIELYVHEREPVLL